MAILVSIIILALSFAIINGFHDSAISAISTLISTKVLPSKTAVIWTALLNFLSFLVFKLNVANTVGKNIVHIEAVTGDVVLSALIASVAWNLLTWRLSIPTSSTHTLIGGFIGAVIAKAGISALIHSTVTKIIVFIFLAPVIGMIASLILSVLILNLCKRAYPGTVNKIFRRLQLLSSAAYSLCQGANDAQKIMGIIYVALIAGGSLRGDETIPFWVIISCQAAMATGTLLGGWRIARTASQRITHLRPFEGFSAETAGSLTLFFTGLLGIPVSTTHTITGSIIGAGVTKRFSAVRWGISKEILWAWIFTIPITSLLAGAIYILLNAIRLL